MDTEHTAATVNREAWAAAQVEEVAKGLEKKTKRERPAKPRGVFFRARPQGEAIGPKGQRGEWWARWYDADGGEHREKAGTKSMALDLFRRRKTEVRQGMKFPETMRRRDVRLKDLVAVVVGFLGNGPAKAIKPEDLERLKGILGRKIRGVNGFASVAGKARGLSASPQPICSPKLFMANVSQGATAQPRLRRADGNADYP